MKSRRLSDTELSVAELVAQGRSNPEVAKSLGLSPKTIEGHVSRVFRKLRVRSRGEIAAALKSATPLGRTALEVEPSDPLSVTRTGAKYDLQRGQGEPK
jgi:DNA-binding CsgD family transcriptional regulator